MRLITKIIFILIPVLIMTGCMAHQTVNDEQLRNMSRTAFNLLSDQASGFLVITSPENGAVFPAEMAAPVITWLDSAPKARCWLVLVETEGHEPLRLYTPDPFWEPGRDIWELIKARSVVSPARINVFGFKSPGSPGVLSRGNIRISTSKDRLDALILYRQVPLPFMVGEENFRKITWRIGDVADYGVPRVVMRDIPVCASCHQATADGKTISMEMNYGNDSGAQFIADVTEEIVLEKSDFMTWTDVPKSAILPNTRGLFARMSPSGSHLVSTVNEISYAALTNEPAFCQLFFPTYGILASYSVEAKTFSKLKGADNKRYVQTNPEWSPDESEIVFARAETMNHYHESVTRIKTHIEDCGIEELNRRFPVQYDLWRVPFNNGQGGEPEPVKGASGNGMSNYFPRYSPDGKWIVFTQSPTGIMLQPGSALYMIPAEGGNARRLNCNRGRMNSWHSWSPNGRWLLFSSKSASPYTEIRITHIDDDGNDSPPVLLSRLSSDAMAANLPEFVSLNLKKLKTIRLSGNEE